MTTIAPTPQTTITTVTTAWNAFSNIFVQHGATLFNIILIVFTVGGQSIIKKVSFVCPCAYPLNIYNALLFMVIPTVALFVVGIMLNTTTWKIVHGCVFRSSDTRHSCSTVFFAWCEIIAQASIAPAAWIFVIFLDGSYYACLRAGHYCDMDTAVQCRNATVFAAYYNSPSYNTSSNHGQICPACICNLTNTDESFLEAQSHIIAFVILAFYACTALLSICMVRMCDRYTWVQRKYVNIYRSEEDTKFEAVAKEHAAQLADMNSRAFFSNKDWTKRDWDWVSGIPSLSNPFFAKIKLIETEKTKTTLYTPLQLWSSHHGYKILKPDLDLQVDKVEELS